ncbi:MAG TPA: GNAT family N-acetyltransferase [Oligoflexia bacterium]|nr:GNAT family N-acetyltransferase [Oligoflexia bacterium]HMR25294.1 GNAT family N-acetyltransferase [Oligoflexia bacterium]
MQTIDLNNFPHLDFAQSHLEFCQPEHYPQLQTILSDTKTMQNLMFMSNHNKGGWTLEQVTERETRWNKLREENKDISYIIKDKASEKIVGTCGLKDVSFLHQSAEYGNIIHHPYWGKSFAATAHYLVLDLAFSQLNLHRIQFVTSIHNTRNITFKKNLGITQESICKESIYNPQTQTLDDQVIFSLMSYQWPKVKQNLLKKIQKQSQEISF